MELGCSRATLKRWRPKMPSTLWQDGDDGQRLYDVEGVRAWRKGQPGRGRPRDVDRLTGPAKPAAAAAAPRARARDADPEAPLDAELSPELEATLLELLAGGGDPRQILDLTRQLPASTIQRLSALGKTRKDLADAEKKELDNRRARGDLVPLGDVESFWGQQVGVVHSAFLSLPGRLAGRLHALETAEEVYEALEVELRRVLEQFSRGLSL